MAKAFDPSKPAVLVGFHNLEGGSSSTPEYREGFEAGLEYVNSELGGVNGHELKADYCNVDTAPETSVNCANEFVEKGVVAAVQGSDLAVDAAMPILSEAGILEMAWTPYGPKINSSIGDAIIMGGSTQGGQAVTGLVQLIHMGAHKVAYVLRDLPATHAAYDVIQKLAQQHGFATEVYYYPEQTDWTSFAPTVLAGGADAVDIFGGDADFLAAIPAFRGAGFDGIINANSFAQFKQLDADMLKDVIVSGPYYNETMSNGVPAKAKADIDTYLRYLPTMSNVQRPSPARAGFYMAVQSADVLRQVSDPTSAAAVKAESPKATGHLFFTDRTYDCAHPSWPGTTSCSGVIIYSSINPDDTLTVLPDQPVDLSGIKPAG